MKMKSIFDKIENQKMAIGHFNVSNLEGFEALAVAAKKTRSPVIAGVSEGAIKHAGIDFFIWARDFFSKKYGVNIFLHLDHGRDLDIIEDAIKKGFDGVMFDGSGYPLKRNIFLTRHVVKKAHKKGVLVEGEVGIVGSSGNILSKNITTTPWEAVEFCEKTGCDILAVALGNSHGVNKKVEKTGLDFDVLKKIEANIKVPLVLHGASSISKEKIVKIKKLGLGRGEFSGLSEKDIARAIELGIKKVNIDSDLNIAAMIALKKEMDEYGVRKKLYKMMGESREEMAGEIIKKIRLFRNNRKK